MLMIHRYFVPDAPPYATMLSVIASGLAEAGHDVEVLSAMPSYNDTTRALRPPHLEVIDGVHVRRMRLPRERKGQNVRRAAIAVLFICGVGLRILRSRPGLVTFSTMPPVLLGVVVRWSLRLTGKPGKYVYHCQDLYPEVATLNTKPRPHHRLAATLERQTRRNAAAVVVLSSDMKDTAVRGGASRDDVHIINNFSLVVAHGNRPLRGDRRPTIAFAGNLGRFQGLDIVAAAVEELRVRNRDYRFVFIGDGPGRASLAHLEGHDVRLVSYVPPPEAFAILRQCDLGLVTLQPQMTQVAFPSKTMTYLAAGCGLVAMVDPSSDLAAFTRREGLGSVASEATATGLADALDEAVNLLDGTLPARATEVAERDFGRRSIQARWVELIASTVGDKP